MNDMKVDVKSSQRTAGTDGRRKGKGREGTREGEYT